MGARRGRRIAFWLSVCVFFVCVIFICAIVHDYLSSKNAYQLAEESYAMEVKDYAAEFEHGRSRADDGRFSPVNWRALAAVAPDVVGWLYIPGTPVNYPIVQGSDNDEYLHKNYLGNSNWLVNGGSIFLSGDNSDDFRDKNSVVYGHSMADGSMFACLNDLVDQSSFDAHRDIYVFAPDRTLHLRTFAVNVVSANEPVMRVDFADDADFEAYVEERIGESSIALPVDTDVASIGQIMSFVTCNYLFDNARAVVYAAVVEEIDVG